jgi:hypothetical protein
MASKFEHLIGLMVEGPLPNLKKEDHDFTNKGHHGCKIEHYGNIILDVLKFWHRLLHHIGLYMICHFNPNVSHLF